MTTKEGMVSRFDMHPDNGPKLNINTSTRIF